MSDSVEATAARKRAGQEGSSTQRGARAGESFATDVELEEKEAQEEYAKSQGATGIAGGARRAKPEYKAGYATWRKTYVPKSKRKMAPPPEEKGSKLTDITKK